MISEVKRPVEEKERDNTLVISLDAYTICVNNQNKRVFLSNREGKIIKSVKFFYDGADSNVMWIEERRRRKLSREEKQSSSDRSTVSNGYWFISIETMTWVRAGPIIVSRYRRSNDQRWNWGWMKAYWLRFYSFMMNDQSMWKMRFFAFKRHFFGQLNNAWRFLFTSSDAKSTKKKRKKRSVDVRDEEKLGQSLHSLHSFPVNVPA